MNNFLDILRWNWELLNHFCQSFYYFDDEYYETSYPTIPKIFDINYFSIDEWSKMPLSYLENQDSLYIIHFMTEMKKNEKVIWTDTYQHYTFSIYPTSEQYLFMTNYGSVFQMKIDYFLGGKVIDSYLHHHDMTIDSEKIELFQKLKENDESPKNFQERILLVLQYIK